MKKIIIVNNNMKVGGVQKSLYNLLWSIEGQYDVTLCLFQKNGAYMNCLPPSVKVVEVCGPYRYLGLSQGECRGVDSLKRGTLVALSRVFGRKKILSGVKCRLAELEEVYDVAISFLHNGRPKSFYGGTQDFVLHCVKAKQKIAFLHGDYRNCGADNQDNNRQIAEFDRIAACSDGCRRALLTVLPQLKDKCMTVRNFHRFDEIYGMAADHPVTYEDPSSVHILMVSRLSHEKGIDRAIRAVACVNGKGIVAYLHLVGDGGMRESLQMLANELGISDRVVFHGEQSNPYRYMKNADLLLMTSYHEAAPMVIDEARAVGLPVLTTETTSSHEMVTEVGCGLVCENSQSALETALERVLREKDLSHQTLDTRLMATNDTAMTQWNLLLKKEN